MSNGKHVLMEKPLGVNLKEVRELVELSKSNKVFLMEAIWSRFFPSYKKIREEIEKGTVGDVLQVFVSFGVKISDVDRVA